MKQRPVSKNLYAASCKKIPGGVNSPVRAFSGLDMIPLMACKGAGSWVWDIDGNSYLDFCGSWGALILGHAPFLVIQAAIEQIKQGSTFGMATPYEYELACLISKHMPSLEKMRFVSSGTEAVMSAARVARGFTGKDIIVKFDGNYHGHSDSFLIAAGSGATFLNPTSSSKGVPLDFVRNTISLPYNDLETVRGFLQKTDNIAAVVLEPIAANMGVIPATFEFIHMLREECSKREIVLIFDEVITGFRVGLGGAQQLYGIIPDLTCLGKIIGGGFPAAAFGGKEEIMNFLAPLGEVYQAGTLSGNPVAMCAGIATLKEIEKAGFYENLQAKTDLLTIPLQKRVANQAICLNQVGSMFTLFLGQKEVHSKKNLNQEVYKKLFTYLFQEGIYIPPSPYEAWFVSQAHTAEELKKTVELVCNGIDLLIDKNLFYV